MEVPLLALARINFVDESRKEGVIQQWLSTAMAIYSGIETIKLIFPGIMQIIVRVHLMVQLYARGIH